MLRSGQVYASSNASAQGARTEKKGNKKLIFIIVILFLAIFSIVFFNSTLSKITKCKLPVLNLQVVRK